MYIAARISVTVPQYQQRCIQMDPKSAYRILKKILNLMFAMTNHSGPDNRYSNLTIYTFKPFRYEEIKPDINCQVPYPRSGHRLGADSANFYSFGGYNPLLRNDGRERDELRTQAYPLFRELWKFNYAKKEWSKYPNGRSLPLELASNALVLQQNVLMVSFYFFLINILCFIFFPYTNL